MVPSSVSADRAGGLDGRGGQPGHGHPTAAALREAVQHVLSDPGYRARAEDLRDEYAKYSPLQEVSDAVDELAARFA
jgi:UDP:flavonoid glycosyltransferase YjiC (YdhE family)